jgi:hypothetical protein
MVGDGWVCVFQFGLANDEEGLRRDPRRGSLWPGSRGFGIAVGYDFLFLIRCEYSYFHFLHFS